MRHALSTSVLVVAGVAAVTAAYADIAAIKSRQKIFEGISEATKPVGGMLRGQAPFNLDAVQTALRTYSDGAKRLVVLFPDDSKAGEKTEALPRIWDNKADFNAKLRKFGGDADAALALIKDEASLKAEFPKVVGQCKGCHDEYRAKKS